MAPRSDTAAALRRSLADVTDTLALINQTAQTLLASGLVTVGALWLGPGGSRFRGPVTRMINPLCRTLVPWLISWVLVVGAALGLAVLATDRGTDWAPIGDPLP